MTTRKVKKLNLLRQYESLIDKFLLEEMDILEFEKKYLAMFKGDETMWEYGEFLILNGVFTDLDAFCEDDSIRDEDDLNEGQLRSRMERALNNLRTLIDAYDI